MKQFNIKEKAQRVRTSWTFSHPLQIILLVLVTVIAWQNFNEFIPRVHFDDAVAYTAPVKNETMADIYVKELEQQGVEQYAANFDEDMQKAMTQVLMREQTKLHSAALELPGKDFSYLQQVVTAYMAQVNARK
jgi:ABC-type phosphate transport system auxiliary subunit